MGKEVDYFVVCEETSPEGAKAQILEEKTTNGDVKYLKFRACMQDFGKRNRNGRLWNGMNMKKATEADHIQELLAKRDLAGENGHPIPAVGQASMSRIMTIDPNNVSHVILNFQWEPDCSKVYSDIMTIDDGNGPGNKFARSIMQGMEPAFSVRSIVPQKKNADGTIDVTGVGRIITYDRVFLPSHKSAYRDTTVDVKQIVSSTKYDTIMESLGLMAYEMSDNAKYACGDSVALESARVDKHGRFSAQTSHGTVIVPLEKHVADVMHDYMCGFTF